MRLLNAVQSKESQRNAGISFLTVFTESTLWKPVGSALAELEHSASKVALCRPSQHEC